MRGCFIIAIIGSVIGFLALIATLSTASGAPQEASGAAIAIGFAVIPYCLARSFQELQRLSWEKDLPKEIAHAVEQAIRRVWNIP